MRTAQCTTTLFLKDAQSSFRGCRIASGCRSRTANCLRRDMHCCMEGQLSEACLSGQRAIISMATRCEGRRAKVVMVQDDILKSHNDPDGPSQTSHNYCIESLALCVIGGGNGTMPRPCSLSFDGVFLDRRDILPESCDRI